MPNVHPDLAAIQKREFIGPKYRGDANGWCSPRPGVPLVIKDFSGLCAFGYQTALREERVNMIPDRDVFLSSPVEGGFTVGGSSGEPINQFMAGQTAYVRRIHPCGKCTVCINWRKAKYQRAALGFYRTTDLTVLGTLTYSDVWLNSQRKKHFASACAEQVQAWTENLSQLDGFDQWIEDRKTAFAEERETPPDYSAKITPDEIAALLRQHRSAMVKRLRSNLRDRSDWAGAQLVARLEVLELGSRNGRVHCHLLWNWNNVPRGFVSKLKEWVRNDWANKSGIGFIQLRKVRDDAGSEYQCKYIGKFETDSTGAKRYVASGNPIPQSSGYLSKGYERYLSTLKPEVASHAPH